MFCKPKRVKYSFIKEHENCYKIRELCRFLNVSACGYYKWITKEKNNKKSTREELIKDIQKIYQASQCRYGAPKFTLN
ncbi:transposase [Wolbachia pipientis]|uniref:transposase n=1 Tax=Wolbachia pipientis TaxID=955 RepID=UPI0038B4C90B